MAFGSDISLIHEVLVTARKQDVGSDFWAALAHSKALRIVGSLATHMALIERHKIDLTVSVVDETAELEEWLKSVEGGQTGCLHCASPKAEVLGIEPLPVGEESESRVSRFYDNARKTYLRQICGKLRAMNLEPVELSVVLVGWREVSHPFRPEENVEMTGCISHDKFIEAVRDVIRQRQYLLVMQERLHE